MQKVTINEAFADNQPLCDFIQLLPAVFDGGGRVLYDERNVIKAFVAGGTEVVVKRFHRPNAIQRIIYSFFRSSKARRAYLSGGTLTERGVATPLNIAYVEVWKGGLFVDGYYVTDVDSAPPIAGPLNERQDFDQVMAADFARFAAMLHEKGILHNDLNSTNVLYHAQPDDHYRFSVIDINRMKFYPLGTQPPTDECLENLTRFTGRMDLFRYVAEQYVSARNLPSTVVSQMVAVKEAHDKAWVRRKKRVRIWKSIIKTNRLI